MYKHLFFAALFCLMLQHGNSQSVGIGAQFGDPTGITLRINNSAGLSYDILAAWNVNDYFLVNVHGLWNHTLAPNPRLTYFYGPGLFAGVRERGRWEEDDVYLGISGTIGLSLYIQRLELFGQLTPRLSVAPGTNGDVGGGLGLRFYLN